MLEHMTDHDARELRRSATITVATVFAGLAIYSLVPFDGRRAWIGSVISVAAIAAVIPMTWRRAKAIRASDRPFFHAVETLALLFTLLLLGFASLYAQLSTHVGQLAQVRTKIDALYFTITTFSTVGFGDAHATGQLARVIVSVQILFDIAFLALAVRLLTTVAQHRAAERSEDASI